MNEIIRGVHVIAGAPLPWAEIQSGVRKYRIDRFNYGLIYHIVDNTVEIIAVAHPSRRPGYCKDRVD